MDNALFFGLFQVGLLLVLLQRNGCRHGWQLKRLERRLDMIVRHLGIHDKEYEEYSDEIKLLIKEGKKIEAIKLLRAQIKEIGLAEAKDEVERIERNM